MWASSARSGGFFWYTCDHVIPDCEDGFPYHVEQGWHDYSFDIASQPRLRNTHPWTGMLKGLRLTGGPGQVLLDYLRLTPTSASSAPPSPVVPLPVVDSPSAAGGFDYATVVRRDPWDMTAVNDIRSPENMAYGFSNGVLNGLNGGAHPDDAHFSLPLVGSIDANRWHRLTFRVHYDGPFGLGAAPGGGMVVRLIWQTAGAPGRWQDSDDIVVFPGWNDVTLDLVDEPARSDHRRQHAVPHRVGRPADHRCAVRPARGLGAAPVPRRQHQDRRGRDRLRRLVRRPVPRQRVACRAPPPTSTPRRPGRASGGRRSPPASP